MSSRPPQRQSQLGEPTAARFARLALNCVDREFPNHILHLLTSPEDVGTPRQLTPAFFGCFDWHSAVHGHWTLVRLLREFSDADWSAAAGDVLNRHLNPECIAGELAYLSNPQRAGFERPYGLAWLLTLHAECVQLSRGMNDGKWTQAAVQWANSLEPLATLCTRRMCDWLPLLSTPIRSGEHANTAFALGLSGDAAQSVGDETVWQFYREQALRLYRDDRNAPVAYEPSGHDFLSPALATADLLRRFLSREEFADWLTKFLPDFGSPGEISLRPVTPADRTDGKIAHLDGLNLSRAWMLEGIANGLPARDHRVAICRELADQHASAGLAAVTGEHYAGGHWLGTFAVYLLTN